MNTIYIPFAHIIDYDPTKEPLPEYKFSLTVDIQDEEQDKFTFEFFEPDLIVE